MVGEGTPISETWVIREGVPYPFRVVCTLKGFFYSRSGRWKGTKSRSLELDPGPAGRVAASRAPGGPGLGEPGPQKFGLARRR